MIKLDIHIIRYDWKVTLLIYADVGYIIRRLRYLYCDREYIKTAINNIYSDEENSAFTVSNLHMQESIINISRYSNVYEFLNTIVHECKHVESHIATKFHLNEKGERVAYMIGELVMTIVRGIIDSHSSTGEL